MARQILNLSYKTWMGHWKTIGTRYHFMVRLCLMVEVANYPLMQIGVARIPNDALFMFTIKQAMDALPLYIPATTEFPNYTGTDSWECPVDLWLDKINALAYVSGTDYAAASLFPWTVPSFYEGRIEYIPVTEERTVIPNSVPDHWKEEYTDPFPCTVFSPNKSGWWVQSDTIAVHTDFYDRTDAFFDGAFVWEDIDLSEEVPPHIWHCYVDCFPWETRPRVSRDLAWKITLAPAYTRGFYNHYTYGGTLYKLEQDRWKVPSEATPYVIYPGPEPPPSGGFPSILPTAISLLGLLGLPINVGPGIFQFLKEEED